MEIVLHDNDTNIKFTTTTPVYNIGLCSSIQLVYGF